MIYLIAMNTGNGKKVKILSLIGTLIVYGGAILIYLYANGWRIDPLNQQVLKTGVLTVESDPFLATLYIEGKSKGRTPKSNSLNVGEYEISVKRDGYIEWKKKVEIKEEKSTPVYPWLIREEIEKSNISLIAGRKYLNSWTNEFQDKVLILTSTYNEESLLFNYELWLYNVNTTFWDLSSNPKVILSFESPVENDISLSLSPNAQYAIFTNTTEEITTQYLIDTSKIVTLEQASVIDISPFSTYNMTWSRDSKYLMFESDSDLISFNLDKQSKYLLIKKVEDREYIWSTDEQGYFYIVETALDKETERVYAYTLTQEEMDGSNPKVLVNDLFFQKNKEYIKRYTEETSVNKYSAFTNSTASTRSVGKIENIIVNQNAQGIFIQTDTASYWYNIKTKRYHLISPYKSELVRFAPDNTKLIYRDTLGYGVFTFLKEESNPNIEIGGKQIVSVNTNDIYWLSNSLYIYYIENDSLFIADQEGENKTKVLDGVSNFKHLGINSAREHVFTILLEGDEVSESISIDRYIIH